MSNPNNPKIGIRPIIDGRRKGIRESLEETTMNLARNVARLYSQTLRYPDGSPIECVIADTCIGGVKEAANCAEKFEKANVGLSLSVTPCWCYGSETIDMNPMTVPVCNPMLVLRFGDYRYESYDSQSNLGI